MKSSQKLTKIIGLGLNAVALLKKVAWPDGKIKIGSSKRGAVQFERCTALNFVCSKPQASGLSFRVRSVISHHNSNSESVSLFAHMHQ